MKIKELPYVELTPAMERKIENIDRHPVPTLLVEHLGLEGPTKYAGEVKYRGTTFKSYSTSGEDLILIKGSSTIVTTKERVKRNPKRRVSVLPVDNSKPF